MKFRIDDASKKHLRAGWAGDRIYISRRQGILMCSVYLTINQDRLICTREEGENVSEELIKIGEKLSVTITKRLKKLFAPHIPYDFQDGEICADVIVNFDQR